MNPEHRSGRLMLLTSQDRPGSVHHSWLRCARR